MKLINSDLGLILTIDDELLENLKSHARKFYPNEFGGLLIGQYSEDNLNLFITDTILPVKFKSSRFEFGRETEDLRELINDYFRRIPSKIYVGEWHTHPNGYCVPSKTDLKALQEIVEHEEVFIDNPILLIISLTEQSFNFCFYVYSKTQVYKYEKCFD